MKICVTGATGFIGSHLALQLMARGAEVIYLVRDPQKADRSAQPGVTLVRGDITDRASLYGALRGVDAVFHLAGWYKVGISPRDGAQMYAINVEGTRNVLEVAVEAGVSKIVYASTVGIFGNTHGRIPNETYRAEFKSLTSEYERTKWMAHYEVALPLAQRGAPLVIAQLGPVVGDGDNSSVPLMYRMYFSRVRLMPGKTAGHCWTHVDDAVAGLLLALDKGRCGETYIFAGQPLTYREAMQRWQELGGRAAARLWLPDWFVAATARVMGWLERGRIRIPPGSEAVRTLAGYTFYGDSVKAQRELGWMPRPLDETYRDVLRLPRSPEKMV